MKKLLSILGIIFLTDTTSTSIIANPNVINYELNTAIKNTNELKSLNPKLKNSIIRYFSDAQGKIDVTLKKQQAGNVYIVFLLILMMKIIKVQQIL